MQAWSPSEQSNVKRGDARLTAAATVAAITLTLPAVRLN